MYRRHSSTSCSAWHASSSRCLLDTKNEISQFKSPQFRGYSRLGGELTNGSVDWREQIDIGPERQVIDGAEGYWRLQGPNLWPAEPPGFREAFERWDAALSEVGLRLLRHWAVSLGADEDVFDAAFADLPATLIKVVRYPGTAETSQGVGAHKDSGVLTLLLVEPESEGLQVERGDDEWIDVPPVPGALIVNIGELLEVATGGYLRATRHRVRAPRPGTDRVSIPYFLNPALDALVPIIALAARTGGAVTRSRGRPGQPDLQHLRRERVEVADAGASRRRGAPSRHQAERTRCGVLAEPGPISSG